MKKKILIFVFSIIIIIGLVFVVKNNIDKKKNEYTIETLGSPNYFLMMQNNKFGVIDRSGNVVIDSVYDIIEMPNPAKDIFICKNNYNVDTGEYNVQVFNAKKEPILYNYYIVEAIALNGVEDNGFYEKSTLKYKSEGLYGLTDFSGKKLTDAVYESIDGFEYKEGLLIVKKAGKYGIININGKVIVKPKYDEIFCDGYYTDELKYNDSGYIVGTRTDNGMRYGYIDKNGKQLLKNDFNDMYRITDKNDGNIYLVAYKNGKAGIYKGKKNVVSHDYEDIIYNGENDLLVVQKNSKQGIAKFDGSLLVPIDYDNIFFAGNYINAQKGEDIDIFDNNGNKEQNSEYISKQNFSDGKYEIVSNSSDEYKVIVTNTGNVIADGYSYIQYLFDEYFIVQKDGLFGIIDDKGNKVIEPKYAAVQPIYDYNIVQLIDDKSNVTILNRGMQEVIKVDIGSIYEVSGYLQVSMNDDIKYINKDGKLVENTEIYSNNKLFAFCKNGKWGFKDKSGNEIVKPEYQFVTEFNEYGFAGIKNKDLWGVIDDSGNIVKEPTYELEQEPNFIKDYYEVYLGYGEPYYTK